MKFLTLFKIINKGYQQHDNDTKSMAGKMNFHLNNKSSSHDSLNMLVHNFTSRTKSFMMTNENRDSCKNFDNYNNNDNIYPTYSKIEDDTNELYPHPTISSDNFIHISQYIYKKINYEFI